MAPTLAFDVYGTLIDTHGVVGKLTELLGDDGKAQSFSQTWRDKQLEYSFRRGLMQNYENFAVVTRDALNYADQFCQTQLTDAQKSELLAVYRTLPAFHDVESGLTELKNAGCKLFAFSNGSADAVETLLQAAGIRDFFDGVVSVDDMKSFKPNPGVYSHFMRESGATGAEAWLISSNPFDVIGSISAGMNAAWVKRSPNAIFDPWGIEPTTIVSNLTELKSNIID